MAHMVSVRESGGWGFVLEFDEPPAGLPRGEMALAELRGLPEKLRREFLEELVDAVLGPTQAPSLTDDERQLLQAAGARLHDPVAVLQDQQAGTDHLGALLEGALTRGQVATQLGVDASRVSQMTTDHLLHNVPTGQGRRYPTWQFIDGRPVVNLDAILQPLGDVHPLTLQDWATHRHDHLQINGTPVSPLRWLHTGGPPEQVRQLAQELLVYG